MRRKLISLSVDGFWGVETSHAITNCCLSGTRMYFWPCNVELGLPEHNCVIS